jgi:hypothetical protein
MKAGQDEDEYQHLLISLLDDISDLPTKCALLSRLSQNCQSLMATRGRMLEYWRVAQYILSGVAYADRLVMLMLCCRHYRHNFFFSVTVLPFPPAHGADETNNSF